MNRKKWVLNTWRWRDTDGQSLPSYTLQHEEREHCNHISALPTISIKVSIHILYQLYERKRKLDFLTENYGIVAYPTITEECFNETRSCPEIKLVSNPSTYYNVFLKYLQSFPNSSADCKWEFKLIQNMTTPSLLCILLSISLLF